MPVYREDLRSYQAESDAHVLEESEKIRSDQTRMSNIRKHGENLVELAAEGEEDGTRQMLKQGYRKL